MTYMTTCYGDAWKLCDVAAGISGTALLLQSWKGAKEVDSVYMATIAYVSGKAAYLMGKNVTLFLGQTLQISRLVGAVLGVGAAARMFQAVKNRTTTVSGLTEADSIGAAAGGLLAGIAGRELLYKVVRIVADFFRGI